MQTGFGSFVTVCLVTNQWPPEAIGFALPIATLSGLFSQVPAGAALDTMRDKRRAVRLGIAGVGLAALLLSTTAARPAVCRLKQSRKPRFSLAADAGASALAVGALVNGLVGAMVAFVDG